MKESLKNQYKKFCFLCNSPVTGLKTKHCMKCNRCTLTFDHHCQFVNNCVGRLNYTVFFKLMISVELIEIFNIVIISYTFSTSAFTLCAKHTTLIINLIRSVFFWVLITHLICFHLFLRYKKLTTLEFINRKRVITSSRIVSTGADMKNIEETNETKFSS